MVTIGLVVYKKWLQIVNSRRTTKDTQRRAKTNIKGKCSDSGDLI